VTDGARAGLAGAARHAGAGLAYPITRHRGGDDIVARNGQFAATRNKFLRDTAALAARLPERRYVINLCADRYRFMVGFAAALCRGQISLLPSSDAPGVLAAVAADYPDVFGLSDTPAAVSFPVLAYPENLPAASAPPGVPAIPGNQPALILFTSGSTGRPAPVPKTWGVLVRSALAAGERLGLEAAGAGRAGVGRATLIGTVPHQHSYGLESTIMLGLQHGLAVHSGRLLYPADIRAVLEAAPRPRVLVTTPVHLKALLAEPADMPGADLILSATAPLQAALALRAEECFGGSLIEIYGCTEAGQVATRRSARDSLWHCLDGVSLSLRGGRTWASGAAVEGVALLQDVIEPAGQGRFHLVGRAADLVNIAGKRASLAHLNHQLLSIDGVRDGVFVMPEPDGGHVTRLAAVAVAPGLLSADILAALRRLIDPAFLPRPLVMVADLPRNAVGKLPREALLALLRGGGG
jgi:acyl-coenzyme A synthetase/AMP-(fatty) acid ligase